MTHGFDDQGRQYDAKGEFDAFEPAPGAHENGRLVQGEAVADLGGLTPLSDLVARS